jgi:hypothetical protein
VDARNYLIAVALGAAAFSGPAAAAPVSATQNSNGKALILVPLTLTKIDDLEFGSIITSGTSGIVALSPDTSARTFTGGLLGTSAPAKRAYFAGAGTPSQQVVIVVTPPAQLKDSNGDTIDVLALTLDNSGNPIRTVDATSRAFYVGVGGIISIAANQPDGDYYATFKVTANYQ